VQNALVVADDLTGAMDTGHGFASRGRTVHVHRSVTSEEPDAGGDVVVVDTDSRDADPETAATAVARTVETVPAELCYKKVDSTLRGNVVAEVDAAVAASGADLAVAAPAFPATGRTTENGRHLVDGVWLSETGYGADESDLKGVFAPSAYPVVRLGLDTAATGAAAVAERLTEFASGDEPALVVCDARTDAHLEAIADGAAAIDARPLYVGSGGLAVRVDVPGSPPSSARDAELDRANAGVLGVVGSVNERTLTQLAAVEDGLVIELDPAAAVRDPASAGRAVVDSLVDLLDRRERAVVTAATGDRDVAAAERAADESVAAERITGQPDGADTAGSTAADRVATALAVAARETVDAATPGGLFLTGGDVAGTVLDALGAETIALTGDSVVEGVPEGVVADGPATGTQVVTKAGGFGGERTILNCLDTLE